MKINPFIPIPAMAVICVILLVLKRKGIWAYIRQIVMVLLLFAINLRIMVPNDQVKVNTVNLECNVIFVVDDTLSMIAEDCDGGTRLAAVSNDCSEIIENMSGARFAVISFNNYSNVLTPFSSDTNYIESIISSIKPLDDFNAQGSDLSVSKDDLLTLLENGRDKGGYNVVFFISDGEDNKSEDKDYDFSEVKEYIDAGAVLGYGTEKGGIMRIHYSWDEDDESTVLQTWVDGDYEDAVSKIDEDNLKNIAKDLGIKYFNMNDTDNINDFVSGILSKVDGVQTETTERGYDETFWYFAIALLVMLVAEVYFTGKKVIKSLGAVK